MAEIGMQEHSKLIALAVVTAFALGACDVVDNSRQASAKPDNPPLVLGPSASASSGASQPSQIETNAPGGGNPQGVPLPDFTPLMKIDGPAVVNVISTNKLARNGRPRGPGRGQAQPEDDLASRQYLAWSKARSSRGRKACSTKYGLPCASAFCCC
jgi:hypothetical protein